MLNGTSILKISEELVRASTFNVLLDSKMLLRYYTDNFIFRKSLNSIQSKNFPSEKCDFERLFPLTWFLNHLADIILAYKRKAVFQSRVGLVSSY